MLWLQLLMGAAIAWAVVVLAAKALRYARTPVHMRWELYPVAHDAHAAHGGSHYEESEHWTKRAQPNRLAELWAMFQEIFLLKGVWEHNRGQWVWSLPFHLGCYAIMGVMGLLAVGGILYAIGVNLGGFFGSLLHTLVMIGAYVALVLLIVGTLGLLYRRLTELDLKRLSAPIDYFNLVFFLVIMLVAAVARVVDPRLQAVTDFVGRSIAFQPIPAGMPAIVAVELILWALMLIYLPVTRMNHFVSKYFAYHQIRWEDEPNRPGSKLERRIQKALSWGVSWSAPHIQKGKTWGEVATEVPQEESSK